jgi:hypothetical protein
VEFQMRSPWAAGRARARSASPAASTSPRVSRPAREARRGDPGKAENLRAVQMIAVVRDLRACVVDQRAQLFELVDKNPLRVKPLRAVELEL